MLPASAARPLAARPDPSVTMMEKHYSPSELAEKWSFTRQFILEHFQDEPGVMRVGKGRMTYRIPESVALRVYSRMVVGL